MSTSQGRLKLNRHRTPYQLTLSALAVPLRMLLLLNAAMGLAFFLIAGLYPALLWVASLSACDVILQRVYRQLEARAADIASPVGLRRLAWIVFSKAMAWVSVPTLFAVLERSQLGVAFVGVICIGLTALAASSVRNSRGTFLTLSLPLTAALTLCVVVVIGAGPGAGLLMGIGVVVAALFKIAAGTNRTVTEWNRANERTVDALATLRAALERSEAVERRLEIAIEIADTYVFEADYVHRTFTGTGAQRDFFDKAYGGDGFWIDPFRNVLAEDRPVVEAAWAKYRAGEGPYRVDHRITGPAGRELWISASAELIRDENGRPRALIGALRDITERKLSRLQLAKALEEAEAASQAKSNFLTVMSHETRTPLNGVLGMVQAMEGDELSQVQRGRLDVLRKSGETLLVLVNSVLDFFAMQTADLVLVDGEINIALVADAVIAVFKATAADRRIDLSVHVSPDAAGIYAGDPVRVEQVLHCLISNALKFTEAGSVSLTVERHDAVLVIRVVDTGIGVSAEQQSGLLESAFLTSSAITRDHGGIGLGLAISQQLTNMMGGSLEVESIMGSGSTFTVTLPLPRLRDAAPEQANVSVDDVFADRQPLRVLVAEDNEVNQLVLRTMLQQFGIEPVVVSDGKQALTAWRDGEWDLILMDIQMPVMDGITATQAIRGEESSAGRTRTPIVAVTANLLPDQLQAYGKAGIDDVVAKPIRSVRLIDAIECALAAHNGPAALVAA